MRDKHEGNEIKEKEGCEAKRSKTYYSSIGLKIMSSSMELKPFKTNKYFIYFTYFDFFPNSDRVAGQDSQQFDYQVSNNLDR